MRYAPITGAVKQAIAQWNVPSTTQQEKLGRIVQAEDPYWGYGEFIYGKAAAALNVGNLCVMQAASVGATGAIAFDKTPNTANLGQAQFVAITEMASGSFGWFMKSGMTPVKSTATVAAAAAVGLTGAGTIGANTAGKQILGYTQLASQTATFAKSNVQTLSGSGTIVCPQGYDGWALGFAITGTGIPASTVVAGLDPDGKTVYTGSAVGVTGDKNATATGAVTVTATYTGYSIANINAPISQGAIT